MKKYILILASIICVLSVLWIVLVIVVTIKTDGSIHEPLPTFYLSKDISDSKEHNLYLWEYKSDTVEYKSVKFVVYAFAEKYAIVEKRTNLIKPCNSVCLRVLFQDERDMRECGYSRDWIINKLWYIPTNKYCRVEDYTQEQISSDTLTFYIRECHSSLDGKPLQLKETRMDSFAVWDTIQTFQLIRKY